MRNQKLTLIALLMIAITWLAPPAQAQDWEYGLFVYGLAAGIDGTVGVGPIEVDTEVSVSEILDNLELGAMFAFRAKKDRWAVMTDTIFVGLGVANDVVDVDVDELIFDLAFSYRFTEFFELLFGARYVDIDAKLAFLGPAGVVARIGDSWVDSLVGLRLEGALGEKWTYYSRFDVGGFGVGSDFTLNVAINFGYRISDRSSLVIGWRYLDFDYDQGEGLDRFKYDVKTTGPQFGLGFHF